ncbi:hypothetical protein ACOME3_006818 [Neoechinorhynchus agilis]
MSRLTEIISSEFVEVEFRKRYAAVHFEEEVYLIGGYLFKTGDKKREEPSCEYKFIIASKEFKKIPKLVKPRINFGVAADETNILIAGGQTFDNEALKSCYIFNISIGKWQQICSLPAPNSGPGLCFSNKFAHCVGGYDILYGRADVIGDHLFYDYTKDTWIELPVIEPKRARSLVVYPNEEGVKQGLYCIGGIALNKETYKPYHIPDIQRYDFKTTKWSVVSKIPKIGSGTAVGFADGKVLISKPVMDDTGKVVDLEPLYTYNLVDSTWYEGDGGGGSDGTAKTKKINEDDERFLRSIESLEKERQATDRSSSQSEKSKTKSEPPKSSDSSTEGKIKPIIKKNIKDTNETEKEAKPLDAPKKSSHTKKKKTNKKDKSEKSKRSKSGSKPDSRSKGKTGKIDKKVKDEKDEVKSDESSDSSDASETSTQNERKVKHKSKKNKEVKGNKSQDSSTRTEESGDSSSKVKDKKKKHKKHKSGKSHKSKKGHKKSKKDHQKSSSKRDKSQNAYPISGNAGANLDLTDNHYSEYSSMELLSCIYTNYSPKYRSIKGRRYRRDTTRSLPPRNLDIVVKSISDMSFWPEMSSSDNHTR